jgi:hypothetical protein
VRLLQRTGFGRHCLCLERSEKPFLKNLLKNLHNHPVFLFFTFQKRAAASTRRRSQSSRDHSLHASTGTLADTVAFARLRYPAGARR